MAHRRSFPWFFTLARILHGPFSNHCFFYSRNSLNNENVENDSRFSFVHDIIPRLQRDAGPFKSDNCVFSVMQLVYKNATGLFTLTLPGCTEMCPLAEFDRLTKPIQTTSEEWSRECLQRMPMELASDAYFGEYLAICLRH